MITLSQPMVQQKSWQQQLAQAFSDPQSLLTYLQLQNHAQLASELAHQQFKTRVTRDFANCMEKGNPDDPLLRQMLAVPEEMQFATGYNRDPVGDLQAEAAPGVLHKYPSRALLITTAACAVHCRYCFRRHFPYEDSTAHLARLDQGLAYIASQPQINEVILSGGDPLTLSDQQLARLIEQLESIRHLKTLRIHSRLPVVLPDRLTAALKQLLQSSRFRIVMVIHSNHPNELSDKVEMALFRFNYADLTLLNQAVLLQNINDQAEILTTLSHRLHECAVMPYYLHMPDPVEGSAHFHISHKTARGLMEQMRQTLPGYLVPKLVVDIPGSDYKKNAG